MKNLLFTVLLLGSSHLFAGYIHDYAAAGNLTGLKELLEPKHALYAAKFDVNAKHLTNGYFETDRGTALHFAADHNQLEAVKYLLSKKAKINLQDFKERTPLHLAAPKGTLEIVTLLIEAGANVSARDSNGYTPLFETVLSGPKDIIEFLLSKGANINAQDNKGKTPLHWVCQKGDIESLQFILTRGADAAILDKKNNSALHWTALEGSTLILKALIDLGLDVNEKNVNGDTPLHLASSVGDFENVSFLLTYGADVRATNTSGRTALHMAAQIGSAMVSELLLQNGADVNAVDSSGRTLFSDALQTYGFLRSVAEALIEKNGSNATYLGGKTLFHIAIRDSWPADTLKFLKDKGCDINAVGENGLPPLFEYFEPLRSLDYSTSITVALDLGADLSKRDSFGRSVLHFLAKDFNFIEIPLSRYHFSNFNEKDINGNTPLDYALEYGNMEMVSFLKNRGVNVLSSDSDGNNCLHKAAKGFAAQKAKVDYAILLRRFSNLNHYLIRDCYANINAKNNAGEKPRDLLFKLTALQKDTYQEYFKDLGNLSYWGLW